MLIRTLIPSISEVVPYTFEEHKEDMQIFEGILNAMLKSVLSQEKPKFIHMLGLPGAGKSTYYKQHQSEFQNYLYIDFDLVMGATKEYQKDLKVLGSAEAFKRWQIPARIAGYELLKRAIEEKKNIFFDHGGTPVCHRELLKNIKAFGYQTKMIYLPCSVDVALKRVAARELLTKRHTPSQIVIERDLLIKQNLTTYQSLVDEFEII